MRQKDYFNLNKLSQNFSARLIFVRSLYCLKPVGDVTFISPIKYPETKSIPEKKILFLIKSFAITLAIFLSLVFNFVLTATPPCDIFDI